MASFMDNIKQGFSDQVKTEPSNDDNTFASVSGHMAWEVVGEVQTGLLSEAGSSAAQHTSQERETNLSCDIQTAIKGEPTEFEVKTEIEIKTEPPVTDLVYVTRQVETSSTIKEETLCFEPEGKKEVTMGSTVTVDSRYGDLQLREAFVHLGQRVVVGDSGSVSAVRITDTLGSAEHTNSQCGLQPSDTSFVTAKSTSSCSRIQSLDNRLESSATTDEGGLFGIKISDIRSGETEVKALTGELIRPAKKDAEQVAASKIQSFVASASATGTSQQTEKVKLSAVGLSVSNSTTTVMLRVKQEGKLPIPCTVTVDRKTGQVSLPKLMTAEALDYITKLMSGPAFNESTKKLVEETKRPLSHDSANMSQVGEIVTNSTAAQATTGSSKPAVAGSKAKWMDGAASTNFSRTVTRECQTVGGPQIVKVVKKQISSNSAFAVSQTKQVNGACSTGSSRTITGFCHTANGPRIVKVVAKQSSSKLSGLSQTRLIDGAAGTGVLNTASGLHGVKIVLKPIVAQPASNPVMLSGPTSSVVHKKTDLVKPVAPGSSKSDGNNVKTDRKTSDGLIYPHCSCQLPESEKRTKLKGLEHIGVLWLMKKKIFTFTKMGRTFMFLMEYEMGDLLPKVSKVNEYLTKILNVPSNMGETRQANSQEIEFMSSVYTVWRTNVNTTLMVTPLLMHQLYKEAAKEDDHWAPHSHSLFYAQQYGHICAWTFLITPMAVKESQPDISSILEKAGLRDAHVPRILAGRKRKLAQLVEQQCLSEATPQSPLEALKKIIMQFSLQGIVGISCSCELTIDDLMEPHHSNGALHFHVCRMTFMDSKSMYCWIRPYGMFVSLQELKVLGLLPWKKHMVESMLIAGRPGDQRTHLMGTESNILRPMASSLTGEISTCLLNLKFLNLIYRGLAKFDPEWKPFVAAKFYVRLRDHECPLANVNHALSATCENGVANTSRYLGSPSILQQQPKKCKRKENPVFPSSTAQCTGRETDLKDDTDISVEIQSSSKRGSSGGNTIDMNRAVTTMPATGSSFVNTNDEFDDVCSVSTNVDCSFRITEFPKACPCIQSTVPFPTFSLLACAVSVRSCDVLPINKDMGQAIILGPSAVAIVFTFTKNDTLFFSVGDLQNNKILDTGLNFDDIPQVGPEFWLRYTADFELRCLKTRKINMKISAFGHHMISAELLCYLSQREGQTGVQCGPLRQCDIFRMELGHVCSDPSSLAFNLQSKQRLDFEGLSTKVTRAWAREAGTVNVFDPCPVRWREMSGGYNGARSRPTLQTISVSCSPAGSSAVSTDAALQKKITVASVSVKMEPDDNSSSTWEMGSPQIALRILKSIPVFAVDMGKFRRTHSDYYMSTEDDTSLIKLIEKVESNWAEVDENLAPEDIEDKEFPSTHLRMYEGRCVQKHLIPADVLSEGHGNSVLTAEPLDVSLELVRSLLGADADNYWIVLTGKLAFNDNSLTSILVGDTLYINWSEWAMKYQFNTEMVFQLACALSINIYRPPAGIRQHLLKHHTFQCYGSPWVSVRSLRAVYYLGEETEDAISYPKTFNFLKTMFIEKRPVGKFSDFILMKKSK